MPNPVAGATAAAKSAFSWRLIVQFFVLMFLFNLVIALGLKYFPKVFAPIYKWITDPLGLLRGNVE